ncbi:glycoside hydrolase family 30 protein [Streptomyces sp. NPDC002067]
MPPGRLRRLLAATTVAALAGATALVAAGQDPGPRRPAAPPRVQVYLTTTTDPGGRTVGKGLERQRPLTFRPGPGGGITVDPSRTYQTFRGGGASFTDTAAWLLGSSRTLDDATREATLRALFDRRHGIGLSFLRNPMGASDLARYGYTYDDLPAGRTDPDLRHFSVGHDLADILPLTARARALNPALTVMASPWTAPAWMKDNGRLDQGRLRARYHGTYARYFVKYLQAYRAHGVPVAYVSAQNEPTCCAGLPSMRWTGAGLAHFTRDALLPALRGAGLRTKVLALDWNWDRYARFGAPVVGDPAIRGHPNFGGVAWHGYAGDVAEQSRVHDRHPRLAAFGTENSGGAWVADQHREDLRDLIAATRNWSSSWVKWSLAVDQNGGPHHGGCATCTGLVTVHRGDAAHGSVDRTVEYYTMGHLTKFVRPGARRIASTTSAEVPDVAWRNPDGSTAVIAYNATDTPRRTVLTWHGHHAVYRLPARASVTFVWPARGAAARTGR